MYWKSIFIYLIENYPGMAPLVIVSEREKKKYIGLFVSIILLILVPPFLYHLDSLAFMIYVLLTFVMANCLFIVFGKPKNKIQPIILGVASISFIWINEILKDDFFIVDLISNIILAVLFGFTFAKIVREIFSLKRVSAHVILGAIAAYLLLGLMGAALFETIELLYPHSFEAHTIGVRFYSQVYLSFVTISTLGYGDITPITPQGQAAAIFVSITGQLYLAILMAMLVGKFLKDSEW